MDPWLHSLSQSLTLRHLASPFIDLDCHLEDTLKHVLNRAKEALGSSLGVEDQQPLSRASIRFNSDSATQHVLVLDICLRDEVWAELYSDDDDPVSTYARPVTIGSLTDGSAGFLGGLYHLQKQVNFGPRFGDGGLDAPPPEEEGERDRFFPRHFLVVLDRGQWHGVVTPSHFTEAVPVRVAILAMLLELEEAILQRCRRFVVVSGESLLKYLPDDRVRRAREVAEQKFAKKKGPLPDDPSENPRHRELTMLGCTMFLDKLMIAHKVGWVLPNWSWGKLTRLESLRNWCCHTADEHAYSLDELADLTRDANTLLTHVQSPGGASENIE